MPAVIGGGLSGLTAAYYLLLRNIRPVQLFEKSNRCGGWVRTELHPKHGIFFEFGPHTIRPKGIGAPTTLRLIEDLGLQCEVVPITSNLPAAQNRMIFVDNALCKLPSKFNDIFKILRPFTKPLISTILKEIPIRSVKQECNDESIYNFVYRRFGRELAEYAISSMICGICAGDAKEISVRFLMNDIFEMEQKYGGVIKGMILNKIFAEKKPLTPLERYALLPLSSNLYDKAKNERWSIYSFKNGIQSLVNNLEDEIKLKGGEIHKNTNIQEIRFAANHAVLHVNGREILTDHVISSIPTFELSKLIKNQHPILSKKLCAIPYTDVVVINLFYTTSDLIKEPAFGFLVPPIERKPLLGIIYDSCCFEMDGTVLTVMMGGKWFHEYFGESPKDSALLQAAINYTESILNIKEYPRLTRVNKLPNCIPQYTVGHKNRIESIRNYIKKKGLPLSVCGAAYDGISVNDVILSGKVQAYSLIT